MKLTKNKLKQLITEELSKKLNENQGYIDKLVGMVLSGNPAATRQGLVLAETLDYVFDFEESDVGNDPTQKTRAVRFNAYPEFANALSSAFSYVSETNPDFLWGKLSSFMSYPVPENSANPDYYKLYFNIYDPDWGEELKFTPQGNTK